MTDADKAYYQKLADQVNGEAEAEPEEAPQYSDFKVEVKSNEKVEVEEPAPIDYSKTMESIKPKTSKPKRKYVQIKMKDSHEESLDEAINKI